MICPLLQKDFLIWYYTYYFAYSDNCPLRKFARPIRVGVWGQGQGQFQGGWGNQRIVPEENCPLVNFGVGNNFPPGQLSQNRYFVIIKNSVETFSCSGSAVGSCSGSWCSRSYSGSAVAVQWQPWQDVFFSNVFQVEIEIS